MLEVIKDDLHKAQSRMCTQADIHRRNVSYEVGDWVLLHLQPYR